MKQILTAVMASAFFLVACTTAPDADNAKAGEKQEAAGVNGITYSVDTTASRVDWIGTKQTGQHNGDFEITSGRLAVENGQVKGGNFVIDISSLNVKDLEGNDKAKLEGHLKSPDFFESEKYPEARFEITDVQPIDATVNSAVAGATHLISGNLTLKDSTRNVTFPAKITVDENNVAALADFNIDRSDWGISYKGPNNPQDWFIKKEVNLKVNLKAQHTDNLQAKLEP